MHEACDWVAGKAAQQMWADNWRRAPDQDCAAWLEDVSSAELSPAEEALQECVLAPIQAQVLHLSSQFTIYTCWHWFELQHR